MTEIDFKKEIYSKEDILNDYDAGLSIDFIAKRFKMNREIVFSEKISNQKAYKEVSQIIYDFIMKRGSIIKRSVCNDR